MFCIYTALFHKMLTTRSAFSLQVSNWAIQTDIHTLVTVKTTMMVHHRQQFWVQCLGQGHFRHVNCRVWHRTRNLSITEQRQPPQMAATLRFLFGPIPEEEGFITYTAEKHQVPISVVWLLVSSGVAHLYSTHGKVVHHVHILAKYLTCYQGDLRWKLRELERH